MFSGLLSILPTTLLYTDPGSGALLLQLLAASLLGGLFYLRKFKSKIVQLFARRKPADPTSAASDNAN